MDKKRIFIFVPGTNPQVGKYYLSDHPGIIESASFSTIALARLQEKIFKKKPDLVLAFCTDEAKEKSWGEIEKSFGELGIKAECIWIPYGKNEIELSEIVKIVLQQIQDTCCLTLDLTHGLRSCPIIFSVAVQYIMLLRKNIEIEGFYYGMFENKNEAGESPIVDLKVYLDLMEWIYAVRVFRDTKATTKLIERLDENLTIPSKHLLINKFRDFNKYYGIALPIKLGETAASLREDLRVSMSQKFLNEIPLGNELVGEITELVNDFSFPSDNGKERMEELSIKELERQARVIDSYFEVGQMNHAIGLIREWILSVLIYYQGNRNNWRDHHERESIRKKVNNDSENDIKKRWKRVRDVRNEFHHHGIEDKREDISDSEVQIVSDDWKVLKENIYIPEYWVV